MSKLNHGAFYDFKFFYINHYNEEIYIFQILKSIKAHKYKLLDTKHKDINKYDIP